MEKIDPQNNKEKFERWYEKVKRSGIETVNKGNSDIILRYIADMREGRNISNQKGVRSFTRLNILRGRIIIFTEYLEKYYPKRKLIDLRTDDELLTIFNKIRDGEIRSKISNKEIRDTDTLAKVFTAFWHWFMKIARKESMDIPDITIDLDKNCNSKPRWVYFDENQFKTLCDHAKYNYKVLMTFLYCSGIRSPSELMNLFVNDLEEVPNSDFYVLNIRDEISKTFGRRIKLLLSSRLLREYIKTKELKDNDRLFQIDPRVVNQYLSRLGRRLFGDKVSKAGEKFSKLTLYDFRHCSCCYWLPRYKSESPLKYRFGWKQSERIHYYSEFIGMKDTITEQDLLIDITASEIERQLLKERQEMELLKEKFTSMVKDRDSMANQFILVIDKLNDLQIQMNGLKNGKNII